MKKLAHFPLPFYISGLLFLLLLVPGVKGRGLNSKIPTTDSLPYWISYPGSDVHTYGVFHFRKTFHLNTKPKSFIIHVSGDERYILYVNGTKVASGPSRSDPKHWRYNTLDIAYALKSGDNIIASVVWNDGDYSGWAQMSFQTGFVLFGSSENPYNIHTDSTWKVYENTAYTPQTTLFQYVSPDEQILGQRYPWNWESLNYSDKDWKPARKSEPLILLGFSLPKSGEPTRVLYESPIPIPEEKAQAPLILRKADGISKPSNGFLTGKSSLFINPHTIVDFLLDQNELTTANIQLLVSGGKGTKFSITYSESLVDAKGYKGNRNDFKNKSLKGNSDLFFLEGGKNRLYQPLFYRTYRYLGVHIETQSEPLEIKDLHGMFTAYPFIQNASFVSSDTLLNHIWKTGWRTARLCAYETYMDCPFYEQLQYIGDTRIQALISLNVSGDDRLMRNAIDELENSMIEEGLTQSRYPSHLKQIIPPFSLFWISMVHDYWWYRKDDEYIRKKLPSIIRILNWHQDHVNLNGMLDQMPYWNFVDWPKEWPWVGKEEGSGTPALMKDGNSSILTLQLVMALQKTADLYQYFGLEEKSKSILKTANQLKQQVYKKCWDYNRKLLSDLPNKSEFSQHAQALAILTDIIPENEKKELILRTLNDTSIVQCTYYYRFYLLEALKKAGLEKEYIHYLGPWKTMLKMGLTTFAEQPEPSRSDCHAWSASPTFELLATVAGIQPNSSGFGSLIIKPAMDELKSCEARLPHPLGNIHVKYTYLKKHWNILIEVPKKLPSTFVWANNTYALKGGKNVFRF